jgi:tetratricopeptide (TPR) repeat protein
MIRTRLGNAKEAVPLFRKVAEMRPNSAESHLNLGIALADASDLERALDEFTIAVKLGPRSAAPHLNRGRTLADLHRYGESETELETANRISPNSAPILYRLALTEKELGNYDRSAGLLRKVVALDPGNAEAHRMLGQDMARLDQSEQAINQWKKALTLDPEDTEALYGLVRALRTSDPAQAKKYREQLAAVQEKNQKLDRVRTLANFAIAAAATKDFPSAIRQSKEALALCGDCRLLLRLHKNLGLIYLQAGNLDDGEQELRHTLAIDSQDVDVKNALARIQSMRGAAH